MKTLALSAALVAVAGSAFALDPILPFSNVQPVLAVNALTLTSGIFPSMGPGNAVGKTLGFVNYFAGDFVPSGAETLAGQSQLVSTNVVEANIIDNIYGGDGVTTFNLPNLSDRVAIGAGAGVGLTPYNLGSAAGSSTITLSNAQLPIPLGAGQPFDNVQPSLALETLIATRGVFPSPGASNGTATFVGEIAQFTGNFIPAGWALADGQVFSQAAEPVLFQVLGNTYGGGAGTFALPDLRGRVAVGQNASHPLGDAFGEESTAIALSQLPPGGAPVNDDQPSLAINYLIADRGVFPSQGGANGGFDTVLPTVGSIVGFAGNFAPAGYLEADGQVLTIASDPVLFAIIGNRYGGDGVTTFALPDLDGRALVGSNFEGLPVGTEFGSDEVQLMALPLAAVPEPGVWALMLIGLVGIGATARRCRGVSPEPE